MVSFKSLAILLASSVALADVSFSDCKYIVTLKSGISKRDADAHLSWARSVHTHGERSYLSGVIKTFQLGDFVAYLGNFDDSTLNEIRSSADVATIEKDTEWELYNVPTPHLPIPRHDFKKRSHKLKRDSSHWRLGGETTETSKRDGSHRRLEHDEIDAIKAKRGDEGSAWRLDEDIEEAKIKRDGSHWRLGGENTETSEKVKRDASHWKLGGETTETSKRTPDSSHWRLDDKETEVARRGDEGSSWRLDNEKTSASKRDGSHWRLEHNNTEASKLRRDSSHWRLDNGDTEVARRGDEGSHWRLGGDGDKPAAASKRGDEGSHWRLGDSDTEEKRDSSHWRLEDNTTKISKRGDEGSAWRLDKEPAFTKRDSSHWRLSTSEGTPINITESVITQNTNGISTQHDAPWGLATLSNKQAGGTNFSYPTFAGLNTFAYVVDTGINADHEDFEGRVEFGYSITGDDGTDTIGHGTHVAGIIAGKQSGVSKNARIVSVKAFQNDTALLSSLIEAYIWTVNDIIAKNRTASSVINLSVGGQYSTAFNSLIDQAYSHGIVNIASAGNSAQDVKGLSPASSPSAITVAAIDSNWVAWADSNYGSLVDIWAPGVDVISADFANPSGYRSMNGTSMAAPYVAGLVLNLKSNSDILAPVDIASAIQNMALKNVISPFTASNTTNTTNILVSSGIWS